MIRTIEMDYEYRIKGIMSEMGKYDDLKGLTGDSLYEAIWKNKQLKMALAEALLDDMYDYSGEELFTLE